MFGFQHNVSELFRALLTETILFPVPHRHVTLTIPKMLRPYFRYHRDLLKDLCRIAHECVRDVMRISLGKGVSPRYLAICE